MTAPMPTAHEALVRDVRRITADPAYGWTWLDRYTDDEVLDLLRGYTSRLSYALARLEKLVANGRVS